MMESQTAELFRQWEEFLSRPDVATFITHLASGLARPVPRGTSLGAHLVQAVTAGQSAMGQRQQLEAQLERDALLAAEKQRLAEEELAQRAKLAEQEMGLKEKLLDKELAAQREFLDKRLAALALTRAGGEAKEGPADLYGKLLSKMVGDYVAMKAMKGEVPSQEEMQQLQQIALGLVTGQWPTAQPPAGPEPGRTGDEGPSLFGRGLEALSGLFSQGKDLASSVFSDLSQVAKERMEGMDERAERSVREIFGNFDIPGKVQWISEKLKDLFIDNPPRDTKELILRIIPEDAPLRRFLEELEPIPGEDGETYQKRIKPLLEKSRGLLDQLGEKVAQLHSEAQKAAPQFPRSRELRNLAATYPRGQEAPIDWAEVLNKAQAWVEKTFQEHVRPLITTVLTNVVYSPPGTTLEAFRRVLPEDAPLLRLLEEYEKRPPDTRLLDAVRKWFEGTLAKEPPKTQSERLKEIIEGYAKWDKGTKLIELPRIPEPPPAPVPPRSQEIQTAAEAARRAAQAKQIVPVIERLSPEGRRTLLKDAPGWLIEELERLYGKETFARMLMGGQ